MISPFVSLNIDTKPLTVVVSNGPEGVVALTRYRGLQFSSSDSSQGESLPHVVGEGGERM